MYWNILGMCRREEIGVSAHQKIKESSGPGKVVAPNLKRKKIEEDWNSDRKLKRPRKMKLEDRKERKNGEDTEKIRQV